MNSFATISVVLLKAITPFAINTADLLDTSLLIDSAVSTTNGEEPTMNDESFEENDEAATLSAFEKNMLSFEEATSLVNSFVSLTNDDEVDSEHERFISFIETHKSNKTFMMAVSLFFSDSNYFEKQCIFLESILMSDIDVFVPWYKLALLRGIESSNDTLRLISKSIMKRYSNSFEKVEICI